MVSCNRNTVVETGNDTETEGGFSPFCDLSFFVVLFCSPHFVLNKCSTLDPSIVYKFKLNYVAHLKKQPYLTIS